MKRTILLLMAVAGIAAAQVVQVNITWPASGGTVTGFLVQRATTAAGPYAAIGSVVAPPTCGTITGTQTCTASYNDISGPGNVLTAGTPYFYEVIATNQSGNGPPSNPGSLTITPEPGSAPPSGQPTLGVIQIH
jgi:hypothetical protein